MINLHFHWAWIPIIIIIIVASILSNKATSGNGEDYGIGGIMGCAIWLVALLICAVIGGIWLW